MLASQAKYLEVFNRFLLDFVSFLFDIKIIFKIKTKMKVKINLNLHVKIKRSSFLIKHSKLQAKFGKKKFLAGLSNLTYINLVLPTLAILRLIFALCFTSTQINILQLDLPTNENSNVSFAPHKITENATTFLAFTKNSSLK